MSAPAEVLEAARVRGWTIATAESCTGGLVCGALTEVPGSSDVVLGGVVSYSNGVKTDVLGVSPGTLAEHGAVSEPVARQMAEGVQRLTGADLCVAITGIAGPGGSEFKPEGRVCFAVAGPDGLRSETVEFGALGRGNVRAASVARALDMLMAALQPA